MQVSMGLFCKDKEPTNLLQQETKGKRWVLVCVGSKMVEC